MGRGRGEGEGWANLSCCGRLSGVYVCVCVCGGGGGGRDRLKTNGGLGNERNYCQLLKKAPGR